MCPLLNITLNIRFRATLYSLVYAIEYQIILGESKNGTLPESLSFEEVIISFPLQKKISLYLYITLLVVVCQDFS